MQHTHTSFFGFDLLCGNITTVGTGRCSFSEKICFTETHWKLHYVKKFEVANFLCYDCMCYYCFCGVRYTEMFTTVSSVILRFCCTCLWNSGVLVDGRIFIVVTIVLKVREYNVVSCLSYEMKSFIGFQVFIREVYL